MFFNLAFYLISLLIACFCLFSGFFGVYCFIVLLFKVFACLFCLSFFIVFNGLITRIGMFCFLFYIVSLFFSFLGFCSKVLGF
ncbi:hypothetical protein BGL85_05320 [Helicobacter pylori]|nr:hypothetical protein BGL85_05320 [Helicobacter pylori]